jgi:hypothetical protein
MQFDWTSSKNGPRCKRLKECMNFFLKLNGIDNVSWAISYCFNS